MAGCIWWYDFFCIEAWVGSTPTQSTITLKYCVIYGDVIVMTDKATQYVADMIPDAVKTGENIILFEHDGKKYQAVIYYK